MSELVQKAYELYFGFKIGDQIEIWTPKSCCFSSLGAFSGWLRGAHKSMPSAVPMVWRESQNHLDDLILYNKKSQVSQLKINIYLYSLIYLQRFLMTIVCQCQNYQIHILCTLKPPQKLRQTQT